MKLPRALRVLLWPLSFVYEGYVRARASLYATGWLKQNRLRGKVISVGNLCVGGAGKTPMVIWLAEKLLANGKRVAILSRGYRGSGGTSDEIELMKSRLHNRAVFGVGKERFAEGKELEEKQGIDVFLLDDGFQHLALFRDLNILLMDTSQPLGREPMLPAGRLREPITAIKRANLLVFTRTECVPGTAEALAKLHAYPVFAASTQLLGFRRLGGDVGPLRLEDLGVGPFFAFCGIGNADAFFRDLTKWNVSVSGTRAFSDHHRYTQADILRLRRDAERAGAKAFVTTEKDAQNLSGLAISGPPVYIAAIELAISQEDEFERILEQLFADNPGAAA